MRPILVLNQVETELKNTLNLWFPKWAVPPSGGGEKL